jgi:hypothetical protein
VEEQSMVDSTGHVVIGMDPHKRSATIEVMAGDETVLGGGRCDYARGLPSGAPIQDGLDTRT